MLRSSIGRAAPVLVLAVCLPGLASAAVGVPQKIDYASGAKVRPEVRSQCDLQSRIPAAIAESSGDVQLVSSGGDLTLQIAAVHAPGGWIFSGPKWVEVKGTLRQGGKSYGFRAKRYSAFNPFLGGTCGILAHIARALGQDIAYWMASPTDGAELGDAQ